MAMRGIENNHSVQTLETVHPVERFVKLADAILLRHGFENRTDEAMCTWLSDSCLYYYELGRLDRSDGTTAYSLDINLADEHEDPIASYQLNDKTDNLLCMLDNEGNIMRDPLSRQLAIHDALEILMTEQPQLAQQDLRYHVDQEFQQLVGAYIISDRHIEKRLDRARGMSSAANREHFTSEAIRRALGQFQSATGQIIELAGGSVVDHVETLPYAQGYRHVTEEAVDRFTHSTARLYTHRRKR